MKRAWAIAGVVTVAAVAGLLGLLAMREQPPLIPVDGDHAAVRREAGCLECHEADGPVPPGKNHPITQRCYGCHVRGGSP